VILPGIKMFLWLPACWFYWAAIILWLLQPVSIFSVFGLGLLIMFVNYRGD